MHIHPELDYLKSDKKDHTSLDSEHFCLAAPVLAGTLSGFFTAVLCHGFLPDQLKDCVLFPFPKAGKNLSLSDNYHPIVLASSFSKVLEWCLLIQFAPFFVCSDFKIVFKEEMSTSLCTTWCVKKVMSRYTEGC